MLTRQITVSGRCWTVTDRFPGRATLRWRLPEGAWRLTRDGVTDGAIRFVRVAVGEPVPADGVLLDDDARFEESLLTGESTPVAKRAGDPVYAGTAGG